MNKTIAITGSSGHIGNVVCRLLLQKGHKVRALYHSDDRSLQGLDIELIKGNVLNRDDLKKLMQGCDIVIHCAAIISIHGDPTGIVFKTNTEGPKNVIDVAKEMGVRKIIHISSVHAVMELPLSQPFDETRPYKDESAYTYDYSKALGEQTMLKESANHDIDVVILRPSSVIGPYDFKPSEMGKALLDFYHQKIPFLPEGGYDFVDVRDVAESIISAIDKGRNRDVYLLSGRYLSMKQLASTIHNVSGKAVPKITLPYWFLKSILPLISLYSKLTKAAPLFSIESIDALKNGHPHMNHDKASKELGHQCRPIEDSLRDFYHWQFNQEKN